MITKNNLELLFNIDPWIVFDQDPEWVFQNHTKWIIDNCPNWLKQNKSQHVITKVMHEYVINMLYRDGTTTTYWKKDFETYDK